MASSLSSTWTCQQCRKPQRGTKHRTMTGRTICTSCERLQTSAALGMLTGDTTSEQVGHAVAIDRIRGWFRRATGGRD
ncbi:hypothetical protein BCF74_12819 [Knoellia remsis]|uniref:Uncharacterized protein n=1 Tax=Knoellia remsis TaxID=407159 RepID=A0A2T0U666_9MICO|nr:hypothetical protein [Knoellia remsis]PRY53400.1 hypothetical protein BCF74_12819 [Knoellia remsis]